MGIIKGNWERLMGKQGVAGNKERKPKNDRTKGSFL